MNCYSCRFYTQVSKNVYHCRRYPTPVEVKFDYGCGEYIEIGMNTRVKELTQPEDVVHKKVPEKKPSRKLATKKAVKKKTTPLNKSQY